MTGELAVAGRSLTNPTVYFRNRPGVVLGMPVLAQFVLTLDLAGQRVALTQPVGPRLALGAEPEDSNPARRAAPRPSGQAAPPAVYLGFGLIPQPDGGKIVAAVAPGSSAANEGLREGDRIVTLDGVSADQIDPTVMRRAAAKGGAVRIVVRRGDRQFEFSILPHARP